MSEEKEKNTGLTQRRGGRREDKKINRRSWLAVNVGTLIEHAYAKLMPKHKLCIRMPPDVASE